MTKAEVKQIIYSGNLLDCTKEEYHNAVRRYLHECASEYIENDVWRASTALREIKRLDRMYPSYEYSIKAHSQAGYSIREQIERCLFWMGFDTTNVMLTLPLQAVWTAVEAVELDLFKESLTDEHPPTGPR